MATAGDERFGVAEGAFTLLSRIHGDRKMAAVLDEMHTVELWKRVEISLARAQAATGLVDAATAADIEAQIDATEINLDRLWSDARIVGYPILPLLNQLVEGMTPHAAGRLHFGATTQDIMDTALALQLVEAGRLLAERLDALGERLVERISADGENIIAARTHAQQATPTTLGAKWAVFLAEFTRQRDRLLRAVEDVGCVSLFGAGGTSAATGTESAEVRRRMADDLGLAYVTVPWHVSRDSVAALALTCSSIAASTVRLAREIVDLSRTEVGEVSEVRDPFRGASSTMPQKANPILSEAIIGFGVLATSTTAAVLRFLEAGHERAAGEWQVEWGIMPQVLIHTSSAMQLAEEVLGQLVTYPERMRENLFADGGALMSESLMMNLAGQIGRDHAHEVVYEAVRRSRHDGVGFAVHASEIVAADFPSNEFEVELIDPESYLGEAAEICLAAVEGWRNHRG